MQIEVGNSHRTRDGRKVVITGHSGDDAYPFQGDNGKKYSKSGHLSLGQNSDDDLGGPWSEPAPDAVERSAFEREMARIGQPLYKSVCNGRVEYGSEGAQAAWKAWQARAAVA